MQRLAMALSLILPGIAATATAGEQAPITGERPFADKPFTAVELARLDDPWAIAVLPDGRMLVTEKAGRMLLLSHEGKKRVEVTGTPKVDASGQGALGEVVLHPDFATNALIYVTYSSPTKPNGIELMRAKLEMGAGQARLVDPTVIYRASPLLSGGHYAGRVAFSPEGHLFLSLGERQKFTPAQDKAGVLGKILRLTASGQPASGNPLAGNDFDPAVWSYGHRNPLGLAFDGQGRLWDAEMGPKGGDEVNLILPGRNYGWPLVSNGDHYDGRPIPDHPTRPELEAPKVSWNPSISPSGMIVYRGTLFPRWRGKALVSALSGEMLLLIDLGADGSAREEACYGMGARIRAVQQGPDGAVYLLEDGKNARLLRLTPKRG